MKLWLLTQSDNSGYDTFDGCVVAAKTKKEACNIAPSTWSSQYDWTTPDKVSATLIGSAFKGTLSGVILASYNAG